MWFNLKTYAGFHLSFNVRAEILTYVSTGMAGHSLLSTIALHIIVKINVYRIGLLLRRFNEDFFALIYGVICVLYGCDVFYQHQGSDVEKQINDADEYSMLLI